MKKIIGAVLVAVILIFAAGSAMAAKGKSDIQHLYLFEKDSMIWSIVEDGAWGKMRFDSDSFVFNGHGLVAGEDYKLIYYPDPWPGTGLMCLGTDVANKGGNVHIAESFDFTAIPIAGDTNDRAKIWLVLSSDVDCENALMTGWTPTEYLFENNLINVE